jgi:hypothetical protein
MLSGPPLRALWSKHPCGGTDPGVDGFRGGKNEPSLSSASTAASSDAPAQRGPTRPPRTVIGDPSQADGLGQNCWVLSASSGHCTGRRMNKHGVSPSQSASGGKSENSGDAEMARVLTPSQAWAEKCVRMFYEFNKRGRAVAKAWHQLCTYSHFRPAKCSTAASNERLLQNENTNRSTQTARPGRFGWRRVERSIYESKIARRAATTRWAARAKKE